MDPSENEMTDEERSKEYVLFDKISKKRKNYM